MENKKEKGIAKELISVIFLGLAVACMMLGMSQYKISLIAFGDVLVICSAICVFFGIGVLIEWIKVV